MRTAVLAALLAASLNALAAEPILDVILDYPRLARPGATITMRFLITNGSSNIASEVTLRQQLPPGSLITSITPPPGWRCAQDGSALLCDVANVQRTEESLNLTIAVKVADDAAGGAFSLPFRMTATNASTPIERTLSLVVSRLIRVQSTADSGDGTFRNAILEANANCGPGLDCEIGFDLPAGSTFEPLTPLPALRACGSVKIDGGNIFRDVDRPYELSGARITEGKGSGIEFRPVCVEPAHLFVNGLAINRFPDDGITLIPFNVQPGPFNQDVYSSVRLEGVFVGTDRTGRLARPNGLRGVTSHSKSILLSIDRCILSGNGRSGLYMSDVRGAFLWGNLIGVGADGQPLGNGAAGIFLHHGFLTADNNVIAYNHDFGVALARGADAAIHRQNSIHSNDFVGIDWGLDGPTRETREELGIPNAPMISNTFYDAETNTTVVYGTLAIEKVLGQRYAIGLFSNRTANARGQWEGETAYPSSGMDLYPLAPGVYAWEVRHRGDLRGEVVTTTVGVAQFSDFPIRISSEFSNAIAVR